MFYFKFFFVIYAKNQINLLNLTNLIKLILIIHHSKIFYNKKIFKILQNSSFVKMQLFNYCSLRKKPRAWPAHSSFVTSSYMTSSRIVAKLFLKMRVFQFLPCFQLSQKQMRSVLHKSARHATEIIHFTK